MGKYGVTAKLVWDGGDGVRIPEELGTPAPNQMGGTAGERLTELAGRTCYDSLGKGRSSPDYHKHILEVGHFSVCEHFHATVQTAMMVDAWALVNRPGIWARRAKAQTRFTFNPRVILDWDQWSRELEVDDLVGKPGSLGNLLSYHAERLYPMIVSPRERAAEITRNYGEWSGVVPPEHHEEKWISLFLYGSRGWCYGADTEVLTKDGWKSWATVTGEEDFATLNALSDQLEYQKATCIIKEPYKGKMYRLKSNMVDLLVTPNHRMFVKKYDTQAAKRHEEPWAFYRADEIAGKRVQYKRNAKWIGADESMFTIPDIGIEATVSNQCGVVGTRTVVCAGRKVSRIVFAEFLGYWLAEGHLDHCEGGGYFTVISQNINSRFWNDMIHCIETLGFTYSIKRGGKSPEMRRIRVNGGKALHDFLAPYSGCVNKRIPGIMKEWDSECQMALIKAHLAGDGSFPARSLGEANTVSKGLADDLQEAALKAGWSATIRVVDRRDKPSRLFGQYVVRHNHLNYVVSYCDVRSTPLVNHNWRARGKKDDEWVDYEGEIYCVTVPNGTLYVRRNGRPVWCGNSHEQVRHRFRTGVSQRSTRFVSEDESPWVDHPLVQEFLADPSVDIGEKFGVRLSKLKEDARQAYHTVVDTLQPWLLKKGVDKLTARKQARGAARGYLGNALATEMVFSASVAQWKRMIRLRCNSAADAEIRAVFAEALPALKDSRYADEFTTFRLGPSPDGIGRVAVEGA